MDKVMQVINLYKQGLSIRKIAQILQISKSTVHRIISEATTNKKKNKYYLIYQSMSDKLKNKLKNLLTISSEEKGTSRVLSTSQIYELIRLDILQENIKLSKSSFYRFLDYFIAREFKTLENLEKQRRLKKEISQFIQAKGTVKRELGYWEIDATGYQHNGKNYFIMQAIDTFTGYVFPALIIENKEKNATYYNKAFNSLDVAYYLMTLFINYGVPYRIKSDNEKIIKNEYIINALKQLGVEYKNTKSYNPASKVIERFFRSLKDNARMIKASGFEGSFNQLWELSIEYFNKETHNFKHIQGNFSPEELVIAYGLGTRQVEEEKIRTAFSQRFERKVINNQIKIENLVYEFIYNKTETDLGRDRENPEVVVLRDLENITNLYVYSKNGEYLGIAKLISQPADLETIKDKQIKQRQKRIEKRIQKIEAEKTILETQKIQEDPYKIEIDTEPLIEKLQEYPEEPQQTEEENIDFLSRLIQEG